MNPPGKFAHEGCIMNPAIDIISADFGHHRQTMDAMILSDTPEEAKEKLIQISADLRKAQNAIVAY